VPRVAFAAASGTLLARVRAGWRGALSYALALGLVSAFAAASAADDHLELQREIRETQEIGGDVSKGLRRVQAENLKLRRTLGTEVRNRTAKDITATTLRLARLDADTARLYVTTLDDRIGQREAALRLLGEDINRRATDLERTSATTLETLGAEAELQQLRELHAVTSDLVEGIRALRNAESERLALAEERLTLLRSRAELRTIYEGGGFDQDPRVVAIRVTISRLARDALRFHNEAGSARPKSAPDPARKFLLQLQAGDAIIRSSVRVGDLELLRVANQLDFDADLVGDDSIPVPILREARVDLDGRRALLENRLAALSDDRLTLEGQRELVRAQAADSADAGASLLGPVQDLAELLDFQEADITRLQQRLGEVAAELDAEIGQRELGALRERRSLPVSAGHWELVKAELIRLPQMTVDYGEEFSPTSSLGWLRSLYGLWRVLAPRYSCCAELCGGSIASAWNGSRC
jgi:hypothetical protein